MARTLGIEITDDRVRAALVHAGFRTVEVERVVELGLEGFVDDEYGSSLSNCIASVLGSLPRLPDAISIALDGRLVSLRPVTFPAGAARRVAELLPFEIEGLLPFEIGEAIISHQLIRRTPGELEVLVAAVPKEVIRETIARHEALGITPRYLCPGAAALDGLIPLMPELAEGPPTLLVSLGRETTDLVVVAEGRNQLSRTISHGVESLRSARRMIMGPELKATLSAYRAAGGAPIERAYLMGVDLAERSEEQFLVENLGVPLERTPLPAPTNQERPSPRFGLAIALAGRGAVRTDRIELRRGEFAPPRTSSALLKHWRLLAACFAAVLASFVFSVAARHSILEAESAALQDKLATISKELFGQEVRSPSRARTLLGGSLAPTDPLPRFDAFDALDAMSRTFPADIVHSLRKLVIEIDDQAREGTFEVHGRVASITERDRVAQALEDHECFDRVVPGPTSPGRGNEGLNYRLEIEIHCPGDEPFLAGR
jgi:general secretion pathway protein L